MRQAHSRLAAFGASCRNGWPILVASLVCWPASPAAQPAPPAAAALETDRAASAAPSPVAAPKGGSDVFLEVIAVDLPLTMGLGSNTALPMLVLRLPEGIDLKPGQALELKRSLGSWEPSSASGDASLIVVGKLEVTEASGDRAIARVLPDTFRKDSVLGPPSPRVGDRAYLSKAPPGPAPAEARTEATGPTRARRGRRGRKR